MSLSQAAIEHAKNERNPPPFCTLMGTIRWLFAGRDTSRITSMTAPSARAVTPCTIGNAYGGSSSNLILPMGPLLTL